MILKKLDQRSQMRMLFSMDKKDSGLHDLIVELKQEQDKRVFEAAKRPLYFYFNKDVRAGQPANKGFSLARKKVLRSPSPFEQLETVDEDKANKTFQRAITTGLNHRAAMQRNHTASNPFRNGRSSAKILQEMS